LREERKKNEELLKVVAKQEEKIKKLNLLLDEKSGHNIMQ